MAEILVVGGGYAGLLCAIRLARLVRSKGDVRVSLIDCRANFVEKIRLHQRAVGKKPFAHPFKKLLKGTNVNFVQGWVSEIDPAAQTVSIGDEVLEYDFLVYAIGGASKKASCHSLSSESAADDLASRLAECSKTEGATALVAGGGMTGAELTTEIAEAFSSVQVTLLTAGELLQDFSPKAQAYVRSVMNELGVEVKEGVRVQEFNPCSVRLTTGVELPFDLVVKTVGFEVSSMAEKAGLSVDPSGRVIVDEYLRSVSHQNIFAIGDAAFVGLRMGCVTAMPMGAYLASQIAKRLSSIEATPFDFAFMLRCVSLGRRQGLIQFVDQEDRPLSKLLRGRLASAIKELVCRSTVWVLRLERWFSIYYWPRPRKHVSIPS